MLAHRSHIITMASLKADLDDYLKSGNGRWTSSQNAVSAAFSPLSTLANSFSLPTLNSLKIGAADENSEALLPDGGSSSPPAPPSWLSSVTKYLPSLSKRQRLIGFVLCFLLGLFCFALSMAYLPVIVLKARKFSLLFSLGSLFALTSFSFLYGPYSYIWHLFSRERLPFTTSYFVSLLATLYFAMAVQSTVLTTIAASVQVMALFWFMLSYIPGGTTGIKYLSKIFSAFCRRNVGGDRGSLLPI